MAWAKCKSCGRDVHWRATRGARLADLSCPSCGGELQGPNAGYGRPSPTKGRKYARCVVCGRRRLFPSWRMFRADRDITRFDGSVVRAGSTVCRYCIPMLEAKRLWEAQRAGALP